MSVAPWKVLPHGPLAHDAELARTPRRARVVTSHGSPITEGAADVLASLSGVAAS